jgi:peptidoglycan hydrolase-like protein with peptidoglycan-binding domain
MLQSKRLNSQPQLTNATRTAPLARGASGPGVATIQDLLADLGFSLPKSRINGRADGIFGPETEATVKQFQKQKGLTADGMVGPLTLGALDLLILANPFLELLDIAAEKLKMLQQTGRPIELRQSAYW